MYGFGEDYCNTKEHNKDCKKIYAKNIQAIIGRGGTNELTRNSVPVPKPVFTKHLLKIVIIR